MASPTYVSVTTGNEGSSLPPLTVACGVGSNRGLLIQFDWRNTNSEPEDVTVGGMAAELLGSEQNGTSGFGVSFWRFINPGTGNQDVSWTSSDDNVSAQAILFNAAHQVNMTGAIASDTGESATPGVTVTAAVGDIVCDCVIHPFPEAPGPPLREPTGGQTARFSFNDSGSENAGIDGSTLLAASTSVDMSWEITNSRQWTEMAVAVKGLDDPPPPSGGSGGNIAIARGDGFSISPPARQLLAGYQPLRRRRMFGSFVNR